MPQLMPLFWNLSLFMIVYIMIVMSMIYFMKFVDYNLMYSNMSNKFMYDKCLLMLFKW